MAQNRNLFRISRFFLLKLPLIFKFLAKRRSPRKRLLIIKTDAIGDYILFRNFLETINRSEKYGDYEIDLLGNALWKDIALTYDGDFIDHCFFINPEAFYHSPLKLLKLALQLLRRNYLVVLQPTYARTFITDGIAGFSAAKQIIGFDGDTERISTRYKTKTDKFYTKRLILPPGLTFEFDKTRFFFETVLGRSVELYGPHIPVNAGVKKGIVIFPGAGAGKRSWEREKFTALIALIRQQTNEPVYLAGGRSETGIGNYLVENLSPGRVINLINTTTLPELIELIAHTALVIANETSAIHIAAATQTNAVCILGGGHFGRFAPYPEYMVNKPVCIYYKMDCYYCNWNCLFNTLPNEPYPCIGNVSLEKVWDAVRPFIARL